MPTPPPDRALRRLIAELATSRPEDIEAVLDQLEPNQRERTRGLLANYLGADSLLAAPISLRDARALARTPGLSPWLAVRLGDITAAHRRSFATMERPGRPDARPDDPGTEFEMTPTAIAALGAAVASLKGRGPHPATNGRGVREIWLGRPRASGGDTGIDP